jgi:hypothetical protein
MKEISHQELVKLVLKNQLPEFNPDNLTIVLKSTIEPDLINKEKILTNLLENIDVPFKWLVNHTIQAKSIALQCVQKAYDARKAGSETWLRHLGWAFHFIVDWGTPYHSPNSKSNPIPLWTGIGAIIGGLLGGLADSERDSNNNSKGMAKGALIGGGITGLASGINLAVKHDHFEQECDNLWKIHGKLIESHYRVPKGDDNISEDFYQALEKLEAKLDILRKHANDLPPNWIDSCTGVEFSNYMIKIAKIMNFAYQIIV